MAKRNEDREFIIDLLQLIVKIQFYAKLKVLNLVIVS